MYSTKNELYELQLEETRTVLCRDLKTEWQAKKKQKLLQAFYSKRKIIMYKYNPDEYSKKTRVD